MPWKKGLETEKLLRGEDSEMKPVATPQRFLGLAARSGFRAGESPTTPGIRKNFHATPSALEGTPSKGPSKKETPIPRSRDIPGKEDPYGRRG